jgi:hypothetical protein
MSNNTTRSVIKIILICFVIYALFQANRGSKLANIASQHINSFRTSKAPDEASSPTIHQDTSQESQEASTQSNSPGLIATAVSKFLETQPGQVIFEEIMLKNSKEQANSIMVRDIELGSGEEVECGDDVHVLIQTKGEVMPYQVSIGSNSIDKYIENGILGMKKGGIRKISFIKFPDRSVHTVTATLMNVGPKKKQPGIRVLVSKSTQLMNKTRLLCGDTITARLTVFDISGKKLFENNQVNFSLGQRPTMQAISLGFTGLPKDGAQLVLIGKPQEFGSLIPSSVASKHKLVLVDIASDKVLS